ncbi:hypothetical protein FMM68_00320 [Lachnospiraceae bacterium MD329]|nr:hypothetical protein [Lachnospiraceae bacterium MD329]
MINSDDVKVICPEEGFTGNNEVIRAIQKMILITLLEEKKININQYNNAVEYLEKKYRQC